ncbi:MAG: MFS transporter [Gammaproteobacteria bacterium]
MKQKLIKFTEIIKIYTSFRLFIVFLLGFASGLPSELTRTALQAWFTVANVSIMSIGLLSLVIAPYIYKFLWAPLMDRYLPPLLGRRTGWIVITQILLIMSLIAMAFCNPQINPMVLSIFAFATAFFSASQDIVVDAYRTDLLSPEERAPGSAMNQAGYRIAMLVAGGVSLIVASALGWRATYIIMAGLMLIGVIGSLLAPEPNYQHEVPKHLKEAVIEPFRNFLEKPQAIQILFFIILYKLSYACILMMTPTFLLRDLGFTLVDVGTVNKGLGLVATLIGVFLGGVLANRIGLMRALFSFALFQALCNLIFAALALSGKSYWLMVTAVVSVNIFAGMEAAVFVSFLMSLCDKRYSATQYALLSALAMVGNTIIGPIAAFLVSNFGWFNFYISSFLIAIPGLILLTILRKQFKEPAWQVLQQNER